MIDIEKLKALERATTQGTWTRELLLGVVAHLQRNTARLIGLTYVDADGDFIVATRNALPEAIVLLEEAREICDQVDKGSGVVATSYVERARAFLAKFETEKGRPLLKEEKV